LPSFRKVPAGAATGIDLRSAKTGSIRSGVDALGH
jgi:hypothetical protein